MLRGSGDGSDTFEKAQTDGAMVVRPDSPVPTLVFTNSDAATSNWRVGSTYLLRGFVPGFHKELYTHEGQFIKKLWVPSEDPEGLTVGGRPSLLGETILFEVGSSSRSGLMVYEGGLYEGAVKPLLRTIGATTDVAGNMGTDGMHIVWTRGEGELTGVAVWSKGSVMAAPFTTKPEELQPKRLRSELYAHIGSNPHRVGCGYAGRATNQQALIVRIADGAAWVLERVEGALRWAQLVGFTCDEVFLTAEVGLAAHVIRIRLDSLGPGMPPD